MESLTRCTTKWIGIGKRLLLIALFFIGYHAKSQVDQRWLRSWNEANKMKPSIITSSSRIAPVDEPGLPLVIKGKILNPDDTPANSVLVHSYHRDSQGYDFGKNDTELSTWRLQGWAKTDQNGNFEFKTIKPASDHIGREGPHIHFTTVSKRYGRQWAPKVFFSDDPALTTAHRRPSTKVGKSSRVAEVKEKNGTQYINVTIKMKASGDF